MSSNSCSPPQRVLTSTQLFSGRLNDGLCIGLLELRIRGFVSLVQGGSSFRNGDLLILWSGEDQDVVFEGVFPPERRSRGDEEGTSAIFNSTETLCWR